MSSAIGKPPPPLDVERRRRGVGASEIAAVLGLSRYADPFTIWAKKTGAVTEPSGISIASIRRRMGLAQEAEILQLYTEATDRQIFRPGTLAHPDRGWQLATPDGLCLTESRGVEAKTAGWRSSQEWGDPANADEIDKVPVEYWLQCQYSLSVTGYPQWDLAAFIGGDLFRIYTITPEPEIQRAMIEGGLEFCEKYLWPRVAPPVGWSAASAEWIKKTFPAHIKGKMISATTEHESLATQLFVLDTLVKTLSLDLDAVKNQMRAAIGDGETLQGVNWRVTWKKSKDSERTDWEIVAKEMKTILQLIASTEPGTYAADEIPDIAKRAAEEIIPKFTKTVPGHRSLRKSLPPAVFVPKLSPNTLQNLLPALSARLLKGTVSDDDE